MAEAGGRLAQAQGDQLGLGGTVESLRRRRCRPLLANQCPLEAFEDERLPHVFDRPRPTTNRLTDLRVIPRRPIDVGLEQNGCPP